jgi:hypothetical protein
MGGRDAEPGPTAPLDRLTAMLATVVTLLQQAPGPESKRCLAVIDASVMAVGRAAAKLAARPAPPDPEALSRWHHALRGSLTAIAGWAQMLGVQPESAGRAVEAIERNAATLMELLELPPD